jgi:hypothetical protein
MVLCPGPSGTVWVDGRLESKAPSTREEFLLEFVATLNASSVEMKQELAVAKQERAETQKEVTRINTSLVETKREASEVSTASRCAGTAGQPHL